MRDHAETAAEVFVAAVLIGCPFWMGYAVAAMRAIWEGL